MNPNIVASYALLEEFQRCGVAHAVICPGSRSTPLAYVAHQLFEVTVVIDERSAGFVALGIAEATHMGALVITTSGSAPTHLFPSVVEASNSQIPMIVLSADRPHEVRGRGAPQTIDQVELFGGAVRSFIDTNCPHDVDDTTLFTRHANESFEAAHGSIAPPGPVQINIGFRDPLSPDGDETALHQSLEKNDHEELTIGFVTRDVALVDRPQSFDKRNGIVVVGRNAGASHEMIEKFAESLGWPIIADVLSSVRGSSTINRYDAIVRDPQSSELKPEIVCEIGGPVTSGKFNDFLAGVEIVALRSWKDSFNPYGHHDNVIVSADLDGVLSQWTNPQRQQGQDWQNQWSAAQQQVQNAIDEAIKDVRGEAFLMNEIGQVVTGLSDTNVLVASSMPIRFAEWLWPGAADDVHVVSHRGTNGIDGMISSAWGIARGSKKTTLCVTGDVAFTHDLGALAHAHASCVTHNHPVVFMLIDNDGGAIFRHLPQARNDALDDKYAELFQTAPGINFAHVIPAMGAEYIESTPERCSDVLTKALASDSPGVTVIHVKVDHESGPAFVQALEAALTE
jgi:2-succinyl-5-enolpyruvyl-6-hydroxy-3-cyclohexene-1-carboxylate synthase